MNDKLAYVKKYRAIFNLIISVMISLFMGIATFFIFQIDITSKKVDVWLIVDLIFAFTIFITLFIISLKTFVKQYHFNKITPMFYIQLKDDKYFIINKKEIQFNDIVDITYKKIHPFELFGTPTESSAGVIVPSIFKFQQNFAKNMSIKGKQKYNKSVKKSNIGNLIIKTKKETITLTRVNEIEKVTNQIKKLLIKYKVEIYE